MDKVIETIRCTCLHKSLANCFHCRAMHSLAIESRLPLRWGHCLCQNYDFEFIEKAKLNCDISDAITHKWHRPPVVDNLFKSVVEMSLESYSEKLKETLKSLQGNSQVAGYLVKELNCILFFR